jgi:pyruvate/2-oxoglutarate dehydrogenase complex dihydrolipoamide acyltransferase (E2) component
MIVNNTKYKITSEKEGTVKQLMYEEGGDVQSVSESILTYEVSEEEQQKINQETEEEAQQKKANAVKIARNALLIATIIDLALALGVFVFVRGYWGIKTLPEFREKMREIGKSIVGEDYFKTAEESELTLEEKKEKLTKFLPQIGKQDEEQKSDTDKDQQK